MHNTYCRGPRRPHHCGPTLSLTHTHNINTHTHTHTHTTPTAEAQGALLIVAPCEEVARSLHVQGAFVQTVVAPRAHGRSCSMRRVCRARA
jgi:hypothetical protein